MVTIGTPGIASPQAEQSYRAYFDDVNRHGGIDNRPVQLLLKDGGIDPARQLTATQELIDEGVVMFIAGLSECKPSLNAYREAKIFVTGGTPDCSTRPCTCRTPGSTPNVRTAVRTAAGSWPSSPSTRARASRHARSELPRGRGGRARSLGIHEADWDGLHGSAHTACSRRLRTRTWRW